MLGGIGKSIDPGTVKVAKADGPTGRREAPELPGKAAE